MSPTTTTRILTDVPDATAAILKTALHAHTSPRRDHDAELVDGLPRLDPDTGERLAHDQLLGLALCALVEHLPVDRLPTHGRSPVTVLATIDHDRLRHDLGAAGLSTGDQISVTAARRLACQHGILPAVLDSNSQVLDLGRTQRVFTSTQRTAMALAHPECQTRGCTIPAAWCEAHHKNPWARGGHDEPGRRGPALPLPPPPRPRHHLPPSLDPNGTVTFTRLRR